MSQFHPLTIKDIVKETKDAVSISFHIPENLSTAFKYESGQYLTLKATINGKDVRRAYSICSSPCSGEVRVAVKQIENGIFSTYANTVLKSGDTIEVGNPEGRFVISTNATNKKKYAAFAAGSGITPIFAMVRDVLRNEPQSEFVLIYGNKTSNETIFYNQLNDLAKEFPNRFALHYTFSQSDESALSGRIDQQKVDYILEQHNTSAFNDFYLCGPETMINTVKDRLTEKGIADNSIHFELFTASTDNASTATDSNFSGSAEVTIILDDEETTITVNENQRILDAALKNGIDAPYSCQGGVCSSCICEVTEGSVNMVQNSVLTDEEVEEGLYLACQSVPTSEKITIDFDNV